MELRVEFKGTHRAGERGLAIRQVCACPRRDRIHSAAGTYYQIAAIDLLAFGTARVELMAISVVANPYCEIANRLLQHLVYDAPRIQEDF